MNRSMHPEAPTGSYTLENPYDPGVSPHKLRFWGGSRQSIWKKHLDCSDADGTQTTLRDMPDSLVSWVEKLALNQEITIWDRELTAG